MSSKRELTAYCAVSPNGYPAPNTISVTVMGVWEKVRLNIREGESAQERGWRVALLRCIIMEFIKP